GPLDCVINNLLQGLAVCVAVNIHVDLNIRNTRALVIAQVANAPDWRNVDLGLNIDVDLGQGNPAVGSDSLNAYGDTCSKTSLSDLSWVWCRVITQQRWWLRNQNWLQIANLGVIAEVSISLGVSLDDFLTAYWVIDILLTQRRQLVGIDSLEWFAGLVIRGEIRH